MWKQTDRKVVRPQPRSLRLWRAGGLLLTILIVVGLLISAGWAFLGRH